MAGARRLQLLTAILGAVMLAGLSMASTGVADPDPFSPWNPALGAGAALILLGGQWMALPVIGGQLAGAWLTGWATAMGVGVGPALLGAVTPAVLGLAVRRWLDPDPRTWTVRQVVLLIVAALATALFVAVLLAPLRVPGLTSAPSFFRLGVGTAAGVVIGLPAVAALGIALRPRAARGAGAAAGRRVEAVAQAAFTLAVGAAAYTLHGPTGERFWSLYFIPLLWTAFRFDVPAVIVGLLLMGLEAIVLAHVLRTPLSTLTNFHFFFFNFAATAFLLAAALRALREAERRRSEGDRRFRELVDTAVEGVWMLDGELRTTYVNRRMAELIGCEPEDLRGRPAAQLVIGALPAALTPSGEPTVPGSCPPEEIQLRTRTGAGRAALVAMNPIVTEGGRHEGTLLMVSDLSDRVRAEHAQRRSEALLASAFRVTNDALVLFRRDDGEILDLNPAWETLTGRPRESLVGRCLFTLPEWESNAGAELRALLAGGEPARGFEASVRPRGSGVRFVFAVVELVNVDDESFGVAFIRDVTESRLIERQRQQAQKLEAVGLLAGGVAHDFNNLLTVVASSASYLGESIDPRDERREDVDAILAAARRGAELTQQLLAFSRNRPDAPLQLQDAAKVVGGLMGMLGRLLGPGIRIVTDAHLEAFILAAPGQLEQVLLNLAVNARDAMAGQGVLTIEVEARMVGQPEFLPRIGTSLAPGPWVTLTVRDTGEGIDPDIQARIFDPFFTTKAEKGTGLGLSTVYGILRSVGGHIGLESVRRQGTTFTVFWPGAPAGAPSLASTAEYPSA